MPGRDHCAVWGCDKDRRYPEKQKIPRHVIWCIEILLAKEQARCFVMG